MNALVPSEASFPFCLSDRQLDILKEMHHRLDTPDRHAWWFSLGKADGVRGYRCGAPSSMVIEQRLYRLGWVFGTLRQGPVGTKPLTCCSATKAHKLNKGNSKCVRCGGAV